MFSHSKIQGELLKSAANGKINSESRANRKSG